MLTGSGGYLWGLILLIMIKVVFIFGHYIATKQDDIVMQMPIEHVPKDDNEVIFSYELAEDLEDKLCVVSEVQYVYNNLGLAGIKVYLKQKDA
jgi:hypothetical protein